MLVNDNSSTVRNTMSDPLYKQLFPNTVLEKERGASNYWKTTLGGEFYAVSTQGQVTGFGAGKVDDVENDVDLTNPDFDFDEELNRMLGLIGAKTNVFQGAILIDDPLKPEDALSDTVRERINNRFENTIRNRTNSRMTPIIIVMQRLHEHDLCGYLQEIEPDVWTTISLPAIRVDEEGIEHALWPMKHTLKELHAMRDINPIVFDTQYMQDPKPKEGLMYSSGFRTYDFSQLPTGNNIKRMNYTDTADTGADSLCSITFIDTPEFVYIVDVEFTDKPMEVTEPLIANLFNRSSVAVAKIEGNNGGRGFARAVEKITKTKYHNFRIKYISFMQTNNKYVRIFTNSAEAQNVILMPVDWERRWPKFYMAITSYRKDNKKRSQHDDAADCLTGVIEMRGTEALKRKIKHKN
jgi:predicted phage terminase large subunit-like protein